MNKRICFILLPLIAILFGINCIGDNAAFLNKGVEETIVTSSPVHNNALYSVKLDKDNNKVLKNKIRIKAWDETFAAIVPSPLIIINKAGYFEKSWYGVYQKHTLLTLLHIRNLRGPPSFS